MPFLTLSHFQTRKERHALFSLKTWYHTGKTWLVIYHTCHTRKKKRRDASLRSVSTLKCLGTKVLGCLWAVQEQSSITTMSVCKLCDFFFSLIWFWGIQLVNFKSALLEHSKMFKAVLTGQTRRDGEQRCVKIESGKTQHSYYQLHRNTSWRHIQRVSQIGPTL